MLGLHCGQRRPVRQNSATQTYNLYSVKYLITFIAAALFLATHNENLIGKVSEIGKK